MRSINVLATQRISADDRARIAESDPVIRLIDVGGWFDGEIRETWTAFAVARYLPPGFSEIGGAEALDRFLPNSDFVVIFCQWTPETTRLFNKDRFATMKPGSVLVNVARGEIVDEEALLDALRCDHLRGAVLDVYVGEFERPPIVQLWSDRPVLIAPHVSNGSDENQHGGVGVFCDNLRAYREGRPLHNVIDWQRGY